MLIRLDILQHANKKITQPPLQPNIASQGRRYVEYFQKWHIVKPFRKPFEIDGVDTRNTVKKYRRRIFDTLRTLFYCMTQ